MENNCEVIVRTQDGSKYLKFELPIEVVDDDVWNRDNWGATESGYILSMGYASKIGVFEERKHAVHIMNYLLA